MSNENLVSLSQAAKIIGISRPTLYKFIKEGKLFPIELANTRFLAVTNLHPYIIHKCATCYHWQDSHCSCREISDVVKTPNKCADWVPRS